MLWFVPKSSRVRGNRGKLGLDLPPAFERECVCMHDIDATDPELIELVVQLCTRIGMIMEDASPLAITASRDGLEDRVTELVGAIATVKSLAESAEMLLRSSGCG